MAEALTIRTRSGFGLATITARKGVAAGAIGQALGLVAPAGPVWTAAEGVMLLGTGPGVWLAHAETVSPFWGDGLRQRLAGLAAVSDQSGACVVLRLSGAGARIALRRGASIDLDPAAFRPDAVVVTAIAHIGVTFWQVDAVPTYDIAVPRSFIGSFHHWLDVTAAAIRLPVPASGEA
ncbi:MAG TPA: sarcosine oxidase subunit gamma family protein [Acidiphilium sp.]